MTDAFWDKYVDECWVVITPEWLDASGHSPEGLDLYGLGEAFARLTGEVNPFPPADPPVPNLDRLVQASVELAHELDIWQARGRPRGMTKKFQSLLDKWISAYHDEG